MTARSIYKLLPRADWETAKAEGVYRGSEHDRRDGFIHFSTAAQLAGTASKYFAGVPDLVLLAVDTELVTPHPDPLPPRQGRAISSYENDKPLSLEAGAEVAVRLPEEEGQDEGLSALKWEPSRGGELFPHLYAALPLRAVKSAAAIPLGTDGVPVLPSDLPE